MKPKKELIDWVVKRTAVYTFAVLAGLFGAAMLVGNAGGALEAREELPKKLRTNGAETLLAVAKLADDLAAVTVEILDEGKPKALGTVVRRDGLVVTKASELGWQTAVRLPDGRQATPIAVAVDEDNDIAALRLDVSFGKAALLADSGEIVQGRFLVCPAGSPKEVKIGIISADSRLIKRQGGALGVSLGREGSSLGGVEVEAVYEKTAAARDGIQKGDVIRSVDGREVSSVENLQSAIASHYPGESVELVLQRGDRTLRLHVTLGFRSASFGRFRRNWALNGNTSTRLSGFEQVIQHDIPVNARAMGGLVVDLSGRGVGINIARVDRVSTFALPTALLRRILEEFGEEFSLPAAE